MASKADLEKVIDFPKAVTTRNGVIAKKAGTRKNEKDWTQWLMGLAQDWRHLVNLPEITSHKLEYRVGSKIGLGPSMGAPRVDAVAYHADGSVTLIEAKTTCSASDIMGGVGQLLYYAAAWKNYEVNEVRGLVLAAPYLPPFVLEAIEYSRAPIAFLKANESGASGLVPDYSRSSKWHGWAGKRDE